MLRPKLTLLFLSIYFTGLFSQTGTKFWFAAPNISYNHGLGSNMPEGSPIKLHITAEYPTQVTISRPAQAGFTPLVYNLGANQTEEIVLYRYNSPATSLLQHTDIEVYPYDQTNPSYKQNKGFLIESSDFPITVYYEWDSNFNRDIVPLKGENGLGTDFWVSTQNQWNNGAGYGDAYNGFVIVAEEDNTIVDINPGSTNLLYFGTTPFSVTLNRGQTVAYRALGILAGTHIQGIHITTRNGKKVAVTIYDDSVQKRRTGGTCYDLCADQTVPVSLVGHDYIIMKGDIEDHPTDGDERIFITATVPNTKVYIDGALVTTIVNAGGYYTYELQNYSTYLHCDNPVYVFHITGSGGGCEVGGALLPTIDGCTGSNRVTIKRNSNSTDAFLINLMVRNNPANNNAISSFTYRVTQENGTVNTYSLSAAQFDLIMGGNFAVLKKAVRTTIAANIPPNSVVQVINDNARFHLGVLNGGASNGNKYGYFSDYADSHASAVIQSTASSSGFLDIGIYCTLDPIQLVAYGGRSYDWQGIGPGDVFDPVLTSKLNATNIPDPIFSPDTTGVFTFYVYVEGECYTTEKLTIILYVNQRHAANFKVVPEIGCSPLTVDIETLTDSVAQSGSPIVHTWIFETTTGSTMELYNGINGLAYPMQRAWSLPRNTTDTIQTHRVRMQVQDGNYFCLSEKYKDIQVKPEIHAHFNVLNNDTIGCQPLLVNFADSSYGDTSNFTWDFGDHSQSFDRNTSHTYYNFDSVNAKYNVKLLTESPFGCLDSAEQIITVHPRIRTNMAINTAASCSPLDIQIDPGNSIGVDTFLWAIASPTILPGPDSLYRSLNDLPIHLYHQDTTNASPDTISVFLKGYNRMGCSDSVSPRNIIVYPEVDASFEIPRDTLCNADSVLFSNTSDGYRLFFNWDFGDGIIAQDTLGSSHNHTFYNLGGATVGYPVVLTATSGHNCVDTYDTLIVVHPVIEANFGLDFTNNCTPVSANFSNLSLGADRFDWNFGDGNSSDTASSTFSHAYWNPSAIASVTYPVKLVAHSNEGCSDSLLRSIEVLPHVVAAFQLSDSTGCSPLGVSFIDASSGGLSYLWNFGNGTTSSNPVPAARSFTNFTHHDTTYYIQLTVANAFGCDSTVRDSVEVFAYIDAAFNVPRADSCSPFRLDIENLSSIGARFWDWELSEGSVLRQSIPNDSTPNFGTLTNTTLETDTLTLRLMAYGANDAAHRACADKDSIQVLIYPELDVNFSLGAPAAQCQPLQSPLVNTTNLGSTDGTYFQWYIDSTFYSALQTPPSLNLANLQDYDVRHAVLLAGESRFGCTDSHRDTVTVYSLVDAQFTVNAAGICSADSFEIDRRTTRGGSGIAHYWWKLGNTAAVRDFATEVFPVTFTNTTSATPATPTTQILRLIAENTAGCVDTIQKTIQVYPQVRARFNFADNTLCYPEEATFNNTSQNATFYIWDFDDGTGANGASPTIAPHRFENYSTTSDSVYTVKLIARSDFNCYDSVTHPISIYAKPEAQFFFPVTVDCPPFDATITNESEGNSLGYSWIIDGQLPAITLPDPPPFEVNNLTNGIRPVPVQLIINSIRGCSDTLTRSFNVYPNVITEFSLSDTLGCSPLLVDFSGTAPNSNNRIWYIDGQAFSTLQTPHYRFVNNSANLLQNFEVTFQASSVYGCSDTISRTVHVYSTPAVEFFPTPAVAQYDTVNDRTNIRFQNTTLLQPSWNYTWNYGDGLSDNQQQADFSHTYGDRFWGPNSNGNRINVSLMAWNASNTLCRDTFDYDITIRPPLPQVALSPDIAGCQPFTVEFPSTTKYIYDDSYNWNFDTPEGATSTETEPTFTYYEPGVYMVQLAIEGDGGTNFDTRKITVYPKPRINYTFNDSVVLSESQNNQPDIINFYNQTEHGQNYQWFFDLVSNDTAEFSQGVRRGDYQVQTTDANPSWTFPKVGVYYTALIATSERGCHDTLIHPTAISVLSGGRLQFPTGFFVDPGAPRDTYIEDPKDPSRNIFRAYGEGVAEFKLEIYNRWGVLVFETNTINEGWNGFLDGAAAKQDVYIWRCKGRFTDGDPFLYSGDVTLIVAPDYGQVH